MSENSTRSQNVIVFSAGESDRDSGNLSKIKSFLNQAGYKCYGWKELFLDANRKDRIALLPMLLKKIPTFDFSIILGEGVDLVSDFRGNSEQQMRVMRDNVLFEAGLSSMALGADRVIMFIEKDTRIVEDLDGFASADGDDRIFGIKVVKFSNGNDSINEVLKEVSDYIKEKSDTVYPVVVGAAISTADGYFNNFVLRFWEKYGGDFVDKDTGDTISVSIENVSMNIMVPRVIIDNISKKIDNYYKSIGIRSGFFTDGGFRGLDFKYIIDSVGKIIVLDVPTTITASYNTVIDILQIPADDKEDADARARFLSKELDTFRFTLEKVASREMVYKKLTDFNAKEEVVLRVLGGISRTDVIVFDL